MTRYLENYLGKMHPYVFKSPKYPHFYYVLASLFCEYKGRQVQLHPGDSFPFGRPHGTIRVSSVGEKAAYIVIRLKGKGKAVVKIPHVGEVVIYDGRRYLRPTPRPGQPPPDDEDESLPEKKARARAAFHAGTDAEPPMRGSAA
jgi:hypothetical protein